MAIIHLQLSRLIREKENAMEFKPYSGNGKPFVYAMFAEEDREGAEAVTAALHEKGI